MRCLNKGQGLFCLLHHGRMSKFSCKMYFGNLNTDPYFFFFFFSSRPISGIYGMNQCAIPLSSGFILLLILPLIRENNEILWKPQGFWISEGQVFTSAEENLIENRGYLWFIRGNLSSPSSYLPSNWILGGPSEPTVQWLASAALDISKIFQGQTSSL